MLPVNDMMLFVEVVRSKSFSKAAKKHGITAPAVSKRISQLERVLAVRLINRTTRKLTLTEVGNILFGYCDKTYLELHEAHDAVIDAQGEPKGKLRISAPTNFCNLILAPILAEFATQYKKISIDVILDDTRKMPPIGDYDIAVRAGVLENSSAISRQLYKVIFTICGAPKYFENHKPPEQPEDLKNHNCIDYNYREKGQIWSFFKNNEAFHIPIQGNVRANNALFVKYVALKGAGLVCLPSFMVADEIKMGALVPVLQEYKTLEMPVSLLYPYSSKYLPKKIIIFMNFLVERINQGIHE